MTRYFMTSREARPLRIAALILVVLVLGLLAGCGGTLQTIKVPVPVECKETVPDRPSMPTEAFTERPALDRWVQAAAAELERREGYELRLRAALEACTAPIRPPAP